MFISGSLFPQRARPQRLVAAALLALGLAACASPRQDIAGLTDQHALESYRITGIGFRHLLLYKPGIQGSGLHVYIEGDGRPWATPSRIATDPTPRNPLVLRLMLADPAPSLYLGRPCQHGTATEPPCQPWFWTHGRYSEPVVASMATALTSFRRQHGQPPVTLIGYSGGGVLAMLLAPRLAYVEAVVTVAANLDIDAWADLHHYSRLSGSLNPARMGPLPTGITQSHWVGGRDRNVPALVTRRGLAGQPGAGVREVGGADHRCCWETHWPRILGNLGEQAP